MAVFQQKVLGKTRKWLKRDHQKLFFATVILVTFCIMGFSITAFKDVDATLPMSTQLYYQRRNDILMKFFGFGGVIITGLFVMVRTEQSSGYQRDTSHENADIANKIVLSAEVNADAASKVVQEGEKQKKAIEELKQELENLKSVTNGNLSAAIEKVFEKAQEAFAAQPIKFPCTLKELEAMMDKRCDNIATTAARKAVDEIIKRYNLK